MAGKKEIVSYAQSDCPFVFVHGLFGWGAGEGINSFAPYWGATTGDLMVYLNNIGRESYAASVGPLSSSWDRACELYAQLMGTTVDYGAAHSKKYGHKRFGRTYEKPLFEDWGKGSPGDPHHAIHVIGHSLGGNTVRLFAHLLTHGSDVEKAETPDEELSGLFDGGKEDWVKSVTTICSPHNGTTCFEAIKDMHALPLLELVVYSWAGVMGRSPINGKGVDFHMEQYGLSRIPKQKDAAPLHNALKTIWSAQDNVVFEFNPDGVRVMNEIIKISPNLYYFSYSTNAVRPLIGDKFYLPLNVRMPILVATSTLMLIKSKTSYSTISDKNIRYANDGLVNTFSALHPYDEPYTDFDPNNIQPGIWNVMPIMKGDHGTPIGLLESADKTHTFYNAMLAMLVDIERRATKADSAQTANIC